MTKMQRPKNKNAPARRPFLKALAYTAFAPWLAPAARPSPATAAASGEARLKIALNAYSFNEPLLAGNMRLDELLDFCADTGFYAVDITAYYFKGYPAVPADDVLYTVRRDAFRHGLELSGTGVRNDFTEPDPAKRREQVALVKNWIGAASKLGVPVIRIFAGNQQPQGFSRQQILEWILRDISECVQYGMQHGVIVAIQNHNDFIRTASEAIELIEAIHSPWFGLILDTGSYRQGDPYDEIAKSIPYAVNWQVKELIYDDGKEVPTDLNRLVSIIRASDYRGYLPIETLGAGDPKVKVRRMAESLRKALG